MDKVEEISASNITSFFESETTLNGNSNDLAEFYERSNNNMKEKEDSVLDWKEIAGLGAWITGLSSFLLINNFIGPWPSQILEEVPVKYFGLAHGVGGMLFAGGIILTTLIEWLVVSSKKSEILQFWFSKVPALDSFIVLPALTTSIVSGVGLAVDHYDSLGESPFHVVAAISTLLAFAGWWAVTDLTTQGVADEAVREWKDNEGQDVPQILQLRRGSNVISCLFVLALYGIMILKPGYTG